MPLCGLRRRGPIFTPALTAGLHQPSGQPADFGQQGTGSAVEPGRLELPVGDLGLLPKPVRQGHQAQPGIVLARRGGLAPQPGLRRGPGEQLMGHPVGLAPQPLGLQRLGEIAGKHMGIVQPAQLLLKGLEPFR